MTASIRGTVLLLVLSCLYGGIQPDRLRAEQDTAVPTSCAADAEAKDPTQDDRYQRFEKLLTRAKLKGRFTILGREDREPAPEEYTILSVKKTETGDFWLFRARIKYGDKDVTVPLPLEVKWAGDTPMITLTDFTIPGMGTFSSRVVLYNNKYAGTWTHGKVGGHLYGIIEKMDEEEEE